MICPICKSNNTNLLLDYGQYPYFTVPVKKNDKKKILAKYSKDKLYGELKYSACKDCGHVYINQVPNQNIIDDLYSNYYSYPSPLKDEFDPIRFHFITKDISPFPAEAKQTIDQRVQRWSVYPRKRFSLFL